MQNPTEVPVKNEIIVKRISASKFEVYNGSSPSDEKTESFGNDKKPKQIFPTESLLPRQTVIKRAPPAAKIGNKTVEELPAKKRKFEASTGPFPTSVILIKDAIMYRIVDILMWKVIGENQLKVYGYPVAPTYQVLWKFIHQNSHRLGAKKQEQFLQDHDCGGNVACFVNHVKQFLDICAPNLWKRTGWGNLSIEEILRRIYYEDLIPYLRNLDLRSSVDVLQCHSDIILLEKWEKQKFTAVTWSGQKYFSQLTINCPKCPQCSNRHF